MFANNTKLRETDRSIGGATLIKLILLTLSVFLAPLSASAGWKEIRTTAAGKTGWVSLVCEKSGGWNSCELDLVIKLTASPTQLVANGEQSYIEATVTDANGDPVEAGVKIAWSTTNGAVSAPATWTDANGKTAVILTSSWTLGGGAVTATAADYGGSGAIWVPFIDKWVAYPSDYTAWANYGSVYSCSGWTPDPSTVAAGTWFTQWASCWQTQIQYRQDRVQSVVTGAVSNNGAPVALFQAIAVSISQSAVGTQPTGPICEYSGDTYITRVSSCRGGGTVASFYHGTKLNNGAGQIGGIPAWNLGGVIYYGGLLMRSGTVSCSGDDGRVDYYQACH